MSFRLLLLLLLWRNVGAFSVWCVWLFHSFLQQSLDICHSLTVNETTDFNLFFVCWLAPSISLCTLRVCVFVCKPVFCCCHCFLLLFVFFSFLYFDVVCCSRSGAAMALWFTSAHTRTSSYTGKVELESTDSVVMRWHRTLASCLCYTRIWSTSAYATIANIARLWVSNFFLRNNFAQLRSLSCPSVCVCGVCMYGEIEISGLGVRFVSYAHGLQAAIRCYCYFA